MAILDLGALVGNTGKRVRCIPCQTEIDGNEERIPCNLLEYARKCVFVLSLCLLFTSSASERKLPLVSRLQFFYL